MKFKQVIFSFLLLLMAAILVFADGHREKPGTQKIERTIATDPAVAVSLCVDSGDVTVRGWDKNQVLARSSEVGRIELKRSEAANASGAPGKVLVWLGDKDQAEEKSGCHAFGNVELMVPRGASIYLQTGDGTIDVADVSSVSARSETGDISIQRAAHWIEAVSFSGGISVENSTGRIAIKSVSGVISASKLRANDQNDCFEASSISGDISLDEIDHQQVTAKSANGKIDFSGPLAHQGQYSINTTSSDVTFSLPASSSFRLNARIARDREVTSDFPLTITIEDPEHVVARKPTPVRIPENTAEPKESKSPKDPRDAKDPKDSKEPAAIIVTGENKVITVKPMVVKSMYSLRRITAVHGSGDAVITVASFSGAIHLEDSGN